MEDAKAMDGLNADAASTLRLLVDRARPDIQRELAASAKSGVDPSLLIILVMDGTSPLASLVPPHVGFAEQGASGYLAKLVYRHTVSAMRSRYPGLARIIAREMTCGHVACLVSNDHGGAMLCVECDLVIRSKNIGEES